MLVKIDNKTWVEHTQIIAITGPHLGDAGRPYSNMYLNNDKVPWRVHDTPTSELVANIALQANEPVSIDVTLATMKMAKNNEAIMYKLITERNEAIEAFKQARQDKRIVQDQLRLAIAEIESRGQL